MQVIDPYSFFEKSNKKIIYKYKVLCNDTIDATSVNGFYYGIGLDSITCLFFNGINFSGISCPRTSGSLYIESCKLGIDSIFLDKVKNYEIDTTMRLNVPAFSFIDPTSGVTHSNIQNIVYSGNEFEGSGVFIKETDDDYYIKYSDISYTVGTVFDTYNCSNFIPFKRFYKNTSKVPFKKGVQFPPIFLFLIERLTSTDIRTDFDMFGRTILTNNAFLGKTSRIIFINGVNNIYLTLSAEIILTLNLK